MADEVLLTNCSECGVEMPDDQVQRCDECGLDGLCADCMGDHVCEIEED